MGSSGLAALDTSEREAAARPRRHVPPTVSDAMLRWFLRYANSYVRRHMHTVRVSQEKNLAVVNGRPVLIYTNHPSWWDPMIAAVLASRYFPGYKHYAPIDADALRKYRFFSKLGFFGMQRGSFESQRALLEIGAEVLNRKNSALWVTPQGRFADVRERPVRIGTSVKHLAQVAPDCVVLPVALEYCFWEESKPEALVRFGIPFSGRDLKAATEMPRFFELHLEETLDALNRSAIARDAAAFTTILSGKTGVGGVYDFWRSAKARLTGNRFRPEHGDRP